MILYLDTETSGLYPGQICQLSYIMQSSSGSVAKNMFFKVDSVEYGAYEVHGFSKELLDDLSDGLTFEDRIDEIEKDINSADLVIAHNTAFDFMFLREEFNRCGRIFAPKNEFCSMKKMTPVCRIRRLNGAGYKYPKLIELLQYFGISSETVQNATQEMYGTDKVFHDARFDTTAVYYALNFGMDVESSLFFLRDYL